MAPVKQNYNHVHPLPPGPQRAVKYSRFLPLAGKGLLGASPALPAALERNQGGKTAITSHRGARGTRVLLGRVPSTHHGGRQGGSPAAPGSSRRTAPHLPLPSAGAGKEPRGAGLLGSPRHTQCHQNPDPLHLQMQRCRTISFLFLSPCVWGNALTSTIKLKVMCPHKSLKTLFATPTDKPHRSRLWPAV